MHVPKGRLLIVTYYFAPKNEMASVRMVNFATGLRELGWNVDVLTVLPNVYNPLERRLDLGYPRDRLDDIRLVQVEPPFEAKVVYWARERVRSIIARRADHRRSTLGWQAHSDDPGSPSSTRRRVGAALTDSLSGVVRTLIDRAYRRVLSNASELAPDYAAIWPTYGPSFMVDVALDLAARFSRAAFIMDVRDPFVRRGMVTSARVLAQQEARERRLATSGVDAVTVVSKPCLADPSAFLAPIVLLPNGFEDRLTATPHPPAKGGGPLIIYYGGRMYPGSDARPLAAACLSLSRNQDVKVQYAGPSPQPFKAAFSSIGAAHLVEDLGVLPREESVLRARQADVVVVLSWNNTEHGILTGKVFELIAVDTPVAAIVSGDYSTSALADLFEGDATRRVFGDSLSDESISELADFIRAAPGIPLEVREAYRGVDRYREYSHSVLSERLSDCIYSAVLSKRGNP